MAVGFFKFNFIMFATEQWFDFLKEVITETSSLSAINFALLKKVLQIHNYCLIPN